MMLNGPMSGLLKHMLVNENFCMNLKLGIIFKLNHNNNERLFPTFQILDFFFLIVVNIEIG